MTTKKKSVSAPAKTAKRAGVEPCGIKDYRIEISLLHQIIEIISNADSLSTLLHHIARALSRDLSYDSCLIYILDRQTGAWCLPAPGRPTRITSASSGSSRARASPDGSLNTKSRSLSPGTRSKTPALNHSRTCPRTATSHSCRCRSCSTKNRSAS